MKIIMARLHESIHHPVAGLLDATFPSPARQYQDLEMTATDLGLSIQFKLKINNALRSFNFLIPSAFVKIMFAEGDCAVPTEVHKASQIFGSSRVGSQHKK